MINRRYTYAFYMFVCGRYNDRNDDEIIALLDRMTVDEKVDILSLNFQQLWYRIWLGACRSSIYLAARLKFNERMVADGGARIKSLARRSRHYAARIWEIPKGRKKYADEGEMDCAIREFYEETGIPRSAYHITPGTFRLSFAEDGLAYEINYFIAITARDVVQRINAAALEQVSEICDMRWVAAADMSAFASRDIAGHRRVIHYARNLLHNPFKRAGASVSASARRCWRGDRAIIAIVGRGSGNDESDGISSARVKRSRRRRRTERVAAGVRTQ
jgi:8-oxo-dGTP pyrophosphatase MutT (NUDIX family)